MSSEKSSSTTLVGTTLANEMVEWLDKQKEAVRFRSRSAFIAAVLDHYREMVEAGEINVLGILGKKE